MKVPSFKILDHLNSIFPDIDLSDYHVICVQHIVASTISLFRSLFEKGLQEKNLSAIGKCYSTRPEALEHLRERGVDIALESLHFAPHLSFDEEFKRVLFAFFLKKISELEAKGCKKLVVLDDGGELLLFMNSQIKEKAYWKDKVVGIEQTTAGYEKLKSESLFFPIVNVARSDIKLFRESPFIAKVAVERLLKHLNRLHIFPKTALIIGNGAVGSHIYKEIRDLFQTEIFDVDASRSTIQTNSYHQAIGKFDLIIGCTGKTVLQPKQFPLLKKGACLVSVSSSDREFTGSALRIAVSDIASCHNAIYSQGIHLLNCGFPINFDEAYAEIDGPEFQLTRAILLAAVYQAVSKQQDKGLVELDSFLQEKIYHMYTETFSETSSPLKTS